jgi:hypothetical protein
VLGNGDQFKFCDKSEAFDKFVILPHVDISYERKMGRMNNGYVLKLERTELMSEVIVF